MRSAKLTETEGVLILKWANVGDPSRTFPVDQHREHELLRM